MDGVRYPLDRWWHMVAAAPGYVEILDEGKGVYSLHADDQRIGYMVNPKAAQWWKTAHDLIPMLITALEEVLVQRDLVMAALQAQSVRAAGEVSLRARVPMRQTDWTPTVARAAAEYLRIVDECNGTGEDPDEPF